MTYLRKEDAGRDEEGSHKALGMPALCGQAEAAQPEENTAHAAHADLPTHLPAHSPLRH